MKRRAKPARQSKNQADGGQNGRNQAPKAIPEAAARTCPPNHCPYTSRIPRSY